MIKKAIFPMAGLGTRFLPLSKAVSKELLPLADKPVIQYLIEEAVSSGITEVIFVVRPGKKGDTMNYFKKSPKLEKILEERKNNDIAKELEGLEEISKNISFSSCIQKNPLGDGNAVLQAKKLAGGEPCAVFFADDVVDSKVPCLAQMMQIFKTCHRPVIALKKLPKEKISHYGVVEGEKISSRLYKIKGIVEKPPAESAPSDLAVVGRYIFTEEVFDYLKKTAPNEKGEIILASAIGDMIKDGRIIYGYEIEGEWLECGDKLRWLKSHLYFSLKHPQFGPEIKKYLKEKK